MRYQTIISTAILAEQLDNPNWVVFDCRFSLNNPEQGRQQYLESHISGACYADLNQDLSSPQTADSGRHPLPKASDLESKLRQWGVNQNSQIIIYDDMSNSLAGRMWWLIRWLGHRDVAVLDGGFRKWCVENRAVQKGLETEPVVGSFKADPNDDMWVSTEAVQAGLGDSERVIIDARAFERYSGEGETVDPEGGHIPTSVNQPLTQNLDDQGCFLPAEELREMFAPLQKPVTIHSCGSGVTACHNMLAMEIAGLTDSRLYVGSWSEWIRSAQRPRATGSDPGTV